MKTAITCKSFDGRYISERDCIAHNGASRAQSPPRMSKRREHRFSRRRNQAISSSLLSAYTYILSALSSDSIDITSSGLCA